MSPSGPSGHLPINGEEPYGVRVLPGLYKEWAATGMIVADEGETTVTADLKIDFLRPAMPEGLEALGT